MDRVPGQEMGVDEFVPGPSGAVAKQLANIPADKEVHRVILPYPQTFLQQLLSVSDTSTEAQQQRAVFAALPEDARRTLRYMKLLDQMKSGQSMLLMPFDLQIK